MPRHVEAWMDGVKLSSVGPFLIGQVTEDAPALELLNGDRPGRCGQRLLSKKRQSRKVSLEIRIRELFDLPARSRAIEELARWAKGSVLELSTRPDRRLSVVCTDEPALGAVRDYTSAATVGLTAFEVPYWEDSVPARVTVTGATGSGSILIPGTADSPLNLTVTPTGGALTSFSVTAGGLTVALTGLSVAQNGTLLLTRDALDNLAIRSGNTSLLSARSAASADDLMLPPGVASLSFTANTACSVIFEARGRWA